MNNISLGRYTPYNTLLHKLDPRTKILSMIFMKEAYLQHQKRIAHCIMKLLNRMKCHCKKG